MAKPKAIYTVPDKPHEHHSGIMVSYTKSTNKIYISGWYDSFVGIEGKEWDLADFLNELGITKKIIDKTLDGE